MPLCYQPKDAIDPAPVKSNEGCKYPATMLNLAVTWDSTVTTISLAALANQSRVLILYSHNMPQITTTKKRRDIIHQSHVYVTEHSWLRRIL